MYKVSLSFPNFEKSSCTALKKFRTGKLFCWRELTISLPSFKIIPDNLGGKSKSSQDWISRQLNDIYVKKCRYDRYRCRSAYKLLEIDERFKLLKPGISVLDCGAAPGSWTQVVVKKLKLDLQEKDKLQKGLVIGVDLKRISPIKGAILIQESNFMDQSVQDLIYKTLPDGQADVILSDMAPNASGTSELDSVVLMNLFYGTLRFSMRALKKNGTFLFKLWDNSELEKAVICLENLFSSVRRVKPKASRTDSSELYLLSCGFKGVKCNI